MTTFFLELALALAFAGVCALAYRFLAKGRKNVRREARWIFFALFLFSAIRLVLTGLP